MSSMLLPPRLHSPPSSTFYRLVKELPLVLVSFILIWAQYTLLISLVFHYLMASRQLFGLALLIIIPFEFCWISAVANLVACIAIGPGWVERPSSQLTDEDVDKGSSGLEDQLPAHSLQLVRPHDGSHPRLHSHSGHPSYLAPTSVYDDPDDDDSLLSGQEDGAIPLLAPHSYAPPSLSPSTLIPRSPAACPLPPSYLARREVPPSNLSFQEQVQQQQRRAPPEPALLSFLTGPPVPALPHLPPMDTLMCKSDGSRRFCRKCELFKADRAHHCSSCGRCVLRMDHHCPWLGGRCVGLQNHKHFLLFLVSSSLTAIVAAAGAVKGLMDFVSHAHPVTSDGFQLAPLNWAFLVLVGALFGMVLTGFTAYHLYLVSVNRTTIENMERSLRVRPTANTEPSYALLRSTSRTAPTLDGSPGGLPSYNLPVYKSDDRLTRSERRKLESGSAQLNVYDLGSALANFTEIFGRQSRWWEWILPIRPRGISNGYVYKINQSHLDQLRELTAEVRLLPSERAGELRFERP